MASSIAAMSANSAVVATAKAPMPVRRVSAFSGSRVSTSALRMSRFNGRSSLVVRADDSIVDSVKQKAKEAKDAIAGGADEAEGKTSKAVDKAEGKAEDAKDAATGEAKDLKKEAIKAKDSGADALNDAAST
eukprot:scaffold210479_cov32-Prasinocladus_malaysianus.AAC.1